MKNIKGIKKQTHKEALYIIVLFIWIILIVVNVGLFMFNISEGDETTQEESKQGISIETMSVIDEYISDDLIGMTKAGAG